MKTSLPPLLLLAVFFFASPNRAFGQLDVDLQLGRDQFIPHETVPLAVRMTNRAGQKLNLYGDGRRPWLDIVVLDRRGNPITPYNGVLSFQAAEIPVGRSVARQVDLNALFPLNDLGKYTVYVVVTLPTGETVQSRSKVFDMNPGRTIYQQRVGLGSVARDYRLITFTPGRSSFLYFQAELVDSRRVVTTYPLGEILLQRKPEATVNKGGSLQVLYLAAPDLFVHLDINTEGKVAKRTFYKRGPSGDPRLIAFANGEVKVAGGVVHDPEKMKEKRDKIRKVTERPSVVY